ncbi:hypothetical protein AAHB54_12320 [Bacillus cereus]
MFFAFIVKRFRVFIAPLQLGVVYNCTYTAIGVGFEHKENYLLGFIWYAYL